MSYLFLGLLAAHIAAGAAISAFLIRWARGRDKSGLKFTIPIVVGSYLLVFWDVIPTAVVHDYLCRTEAGVTVYKDANAWAAEHPEESKTVRPLAGSALFRTNGDRGGYWLNNRFYVEDDSHKVALIPVFINTESIRDARTGSILVEKRWISSGYRRSSGGGMTLCWLKGWVGIRNCFAQMNEFSDQHRMYSNINGAQK